MKKIWWTWDVRMHWTHGFSFTADSFIKNYRLAVDRAVDYGVDGFVVWGFLRDCHGGIAAAHQVLDYARKHGIEIFPGFGVDDYGGAYYQGDSEWSLDQFISKNPEFQARDADGTLRTHRWPMNDWTIRKLCCPSCEPAMEFYFKSIDWLLQEFDLQGFQIEQGDSGLCHCEKCRRNFNFAENRSAFNLDISTRRLIPVVRHALQQKQGLTIIVETYSGMEPEKLAHNAHLFKAYPEEVYLSWQAYNGFALPEQRFLLNEQSLSPTRHGCIAVRANSEAALGESETPEEIANAVALAKNAGLDMAYIYGEYPDFWPKTAKVYDVWSRACNEKKGR